MSKFKNLVKYILFENNLLFEGIKEVKKYFPLIDDDDFNKLLSLDPTYEKGDELGKYSKWILSLYNNFLKDQNAYVKWKEQKKLGKNYPEPLKKSVDKIEDFEKLPNLLKQFDVINKKSKININTLKSISDLSVIVSQEKDKGISDNTKVNHGIDLFKKSVSKGGKIVFKNSKWIVLVPETLESSVVFGNDTHWCTTTSNGKYYNRYLKEFGGQYFINLDLSSGNLYQFHFESNQFMDSSDRSIELQEIIKDEKLKQFYINYIKNNDFKYKERYLLQLGVKLSEEEQIAVIKQDWKAIKYIKNPSKKVQLATVKQNGWIIQYIDNPTEEMQLEAVKQDGFVIEVIENPTEEVQLAAVTKNPFSISNIITKGIIPSEEVQLEAVQQDGVAIQFIKNPSKKVQLAAIKKDPNAIEFILRKGINLSEKIKLAIINSEPHTIRFIENPSKEMQLTAVKKDEYAIKCIKNPSEEVLLAAVNKNGFVISAIENPSEKVQLAAINKNPETINYIKNPTEKVKQLANKLLERN